MEAKKPGVKQLPQGHALATASAEAPVNMAIGLFQLVESSEREGHHSFTVCHRVTDQPVNHASGAEFRSCGASTGLEPWG